MKEVYQTRFGVGPQTLAAAEGNCYAACVASILEISLEDVPDHADYGNFWADWREWYRDKGLCPLEITSDEPIPGYSIGTVASPTREGYYHAVVCLDGEVVHDPLPNSTNDPRAYKVESYEILFMLDPAGWLR